MAKKKIIITEKFKEIINVDIPPRCSLHQIVKGNGKSKEHKHRQCILCRYYTKDIWCERCYECLQTDNLCNWEVDKFIEDADWYKYIVEHNE